MAEVLEDQKDKLSGNLKAGDSNLNSFVLYVCDCRQ